MKINIENKLAKFGIFYVFFGMFSACLAVELLMNDLVFRDWLKMLIIGFGIVGFFIILIATCVKISKKLKLWLKLVMGIVVIAIITVTLVVCYILHGIFYTPEHVEVLDGKKYVTDVDLFLKLRVDYYEYKGPFLKGNTKKISAFYEPACPDPYSNSYKGKVVYYYYDNDGNPVEEKESYY